MRSSSWCLVLWFCALMFGVVVDPGIAQSEEEITNNRILRAIENEEQLNQELDQALAVLKERGVKPGEYLLGQAANSHYEGCMIAAVHEVVMVADQLGREDLLRQYRPLYGWMLENDLDYCEGGNYYYSQCDQAYEQYAAVGWTLAARRCALKYAEWLLECYRDGGVYGDRYSDEDEWLGDGPWPFPFEDVLVWYARAGWNQERLDTLERSITPTVVADPTR